jgi:hypothetical protein
MKSIRLLVAGISSVLLAAGYLASQNAVFQGQTKEYAERVDQPPIVYLSLAIFLIAVVFYVLPDRKEPEE